MALLAAGMALCLADCGTSPGSAASPSPSSSSSTAAHLTPAQFVPTYFAARARAVLPGQPLRPLHRFFLDGVPCRAREDLVAVGTLLAQKALGHTLTAVDCHVTLRRITPAHPAKLVWAHVEADVTTTLHWTDADGRPGSTTKRLMHTLTIVLTDTDSAVWAVVDDAYVDRELPHLLTLARAGSDVVKAARTDVRARTADVRPIANTALRYWRTQHDWATFTVGGVAPDGRYLDLLAPGSPSRSIQRYAVLGARWSLHHFGSQGSLYLLSIAFDEIRVNRARDKATVRATCSLVQAASEAQSWAQTIEVTRRSLVLHKISGRWSIWRDDYPPIEDLTWAPAPVAAYREALQEALRVGALGDERAAPPAAIAAMRDYFATTSPGAFYASRIAFVGAFLPSPDLFNRPASPLRLYLNVYYGAWGPHVPWAGNNHPGYNNDFYLLTRTSPTAAWRVWGEVVP